MTSDSAANERESSRAANRLVLFAPNLYGGGAERTLARLATHWAEQGRVVTLVTLALISPDDFRISSRVNRIGLGLTNHRRGLLGGVRANVDRISRLREVIAATHADVVVSFIEQSNVVALLAARPLAIPVVISERTDPERHPIGRMWHWLRRRTYSRCAALVVLTDEIAYHMRKFVHGPRIVVIPNGIAAPSLALREHSTPSVIAVGRLDAAKGFDRLMEAFAMVAGEHPEWQLAVVGEGPQRKNLEQYVLDRQLAGRVVFVGRVADPAIPLASADIFALPSRYEGFPNALLEAMAIGLPAVAFDGSGAVRQVIRHGIDGIVVPEGDVSAFAAALRRLMSDAVARQRMGLQAREVADRYSLTSFFARWDAIIEEVAQTNF